MSEESLKRVFVAVWSRFLEFEITRSKLICGFAGNPLSALILRVVAYHNLTLVQSNVDNKSYSKIWSAWKVSDKSLARVWPQKLSFFYMPCLDHK